MMRKALLVALLVATTVGSSGCFGHSIQRTSDPSRAMISNVGANRYIYAVTPVVPRDPVDSPATPVVSVAPEGAEEVAIISLTAKLGGWGAGGLRKTEAEFYPELGILAAELGGTRFHVANKDMTATFITSMTISVLAE